VRAFPHARTPYLNVQRRTTTILTGVLMLLTSVNCGGSGSGSGLPTVNDISPTVPQSSQRAETTIPMATSARLEASATFGPTNVPNLAAWYDASDSSTSVQSNGQVSQLKDKSGLSNDLLQSSSALQPKLLNGAINGHAALSFNGNALLTGSDTTFSTKVLNESTTFFVANQPNKTQTSSVLWSGPFFGTPRWTVRLSEHGVSHFDFNDLSAGRITGTEDPTGSAVWSAGGSVTNHRQFLSKNGVVVASGSATQRGTVNAQLQVGGMSNGQRQVYTYTGLLGEIVVFNRALSTSETAQIEGYMACKWGLQSSLPASHPFRSVCPTLSTPQPVSSPSPVPSAPPTPQPPPTTKPPAHVMTAEYVSGGDGGYTGPCSSAAPYITFGNDVPTTTENVACQAAGVKTYRYIDPSISYHNVSSGAFTYNDICTSGLPQCPQNGPDSAAIARSSAGGSIVSLGSSNGGYFTDPTILPYAQNHVNHILTNTSAFNGVNYWFADDFCSIVDLNATPYTFSNWSQYLTACGAVLQNARKSDGTSPQWIINDGHLTAFGVPVSTWSVTLADSNIAGHMREGCFNNYTGDWANAQNQHIATVNAHKQFWCLVTDYASPQSRMAQRMYYYASFLLAYDPNYSVYETTFPENSGLRVEPETGFVPLNPVIANPSTVAQLAVGGTYSRQYQSCYYRGASVGACAIVVNPSGSAASYPFGSKYAHTLTLSGSGVLDGGKALVTGGSPSSSIAGNSATIAIQ
jgi:hypothetical protein